MTLEGDVDLAIELESGASHATKGKSGSAPSLPPSTLLLSPSQHLLAYLPPSSTPFEHCHTTDSLSLTSLFPHRSRTLWHLLRRSAISESDFSVQRRRYAPSLHCHDAIDASHLTLNVMEP